MKKLVLLAVGAILLLGLVAVVAVLIASRDPDGAPGSGAPAVPPASPARPGAEAPVAPSGPAAPTQTGYPPGPRHVQLPAGRVKAVLTLELEAQSCGGFAVLGSSVKS